MAGKTEPPSRSRPRRRKAERARREIDMRRRRTKNQVCCQKGKSGGGRGRLREGWEGGGEGVTGFFLRERDSVARVAPRARSARLSRAKDRKRC